MATQEDTQCFSPSSLSRVSVIIISLAILPKDVSYSFAKTVSSQRQLAAVLWTVRQLSDNVTTNQVSCSGVLGLQSRPRNPSTDWSSSLFSSVPPHRL